MHTVLVHDWLYTYMGSEKVMEAILHCLPVAAIYTTVDFLPRKNAPFCRACRYGRLFSKNCRGPGRFAVIICP